MIGTTSVLSLPLDQVQTDTRIADQLFDQCFTLSSLLLNAIQAQIELISGAVFTEGDRWELVTFIDKDTFFIAISPTTVSGLELELWHAIGHQASINVFGSLHQCNVEKLNILRSLAMYHNKNTHPSKVA